MKVVCKSDVVGALPVGTAPTTSSFSTKHLAPMDWAKTTARQYEKHLSFGIWCALYKRFGGKLFKYITFHLKTTPCKIQPSPLPHHFLCWCELMRDADGLALTALLMTQVLQNAGCWHCKDEHHEMLNTLMPRQHGRYFIDDIFKCIFLNENVWILLTISLKLVPKFPINNFSNWQYSSIGSDNCLAATIIWSNDG